MFFGQTKTCLFLGWPNPSRPNQPKRDMFWFGRQSILLLFIRYVIRVRFSKNSQNLLNKSPKDGGAKAPPAPPAPPPLFKCRKHKKALPTKNCGKFPSFAAGSKNFLLETSLMIFLFAFYDRKDNPDLLKVKFEGKMGYNLKLYN